MSSLGLLSTMDDYADAFSARQGECWRSEVAWERASTRADYDALADQGEQFSVATALLLFLESGEG